MPAKLARGKLTPPYCSRADDLKETEDEFMEVYQRLISLCQQQDACFRPTAKAVHGILQSLVSKPAEANGLLEAQEKRAVLGRKMFNFFVKHNQQRLSVLDGGKKMCV